MPGAPPRDTSARGRPRGRHRRRAWPRRGRGHRAAAAPGPRHAAPARPGRAARDAERRRRRVRVRRLPAGRLQLHGLEGALRRRRGWARDGPAARAGRSSWPTARRRQRRADAPAAGVITGRVLDDFGDVVPGVTVMPMRFRTINGERQLMPTGRRGLRRHRHVPPLRLAHRATTTSRHAPTSAPLRPALDDPDATGFAPTFYPGTPDRGRGPADRGRRRRRNRRRPHARHRRASRRSAASSWTRGGAATGGHVMAMQRRRAAPSCRRRRRRPRSSRTGRSRSRASRPASTSSRRGPRSAPRRCSTTSTANAERLAIASVAVTGEPIDGLRLVVQDRFASL